MLTGFLLSNSAEMLLSLPETPSELIITNDGTPEKVKVLIKEGTVPYVLDTYNMFSLVMCLVINWGKFQGRPA